MLNFGEYSKYYDLLYADKDYEREADYLYDLIREQAPYAAGLLELGCGTARHALHLSAKGLAVTGVEKSETMLAMARANLERAPGHRVSLRQGDLLEYRDEKRYDCVVSVFHVLSYQTSESMIRRFFRTAADHLNPEGLLLFDFWYGPAVLTQRPETRVKRCENDHMQVVRIAEPDLDLARDTVCVQYQVFCKNQPQGELQEFSENHLMRYFFLPQLSQLVEAAGLRCLEFRAWLSDTPPSADSWGVVCIAKKTDPTGSNESVSKH